MIHILCFRQKTRRSKSPLSSILINPQITAKQLPSIEPSPEDFGKSPHALIPDTQLSSILTHSDFFGQQENSTQGKIVLAQTVDVRKTVSDARHGP